MFRNRGRRRTEGLGLLLLGGQLMRVGLDRIPPTTLGTIAINVAIYLKVCSLKGFWYRNLGCISAVVTNKARFILPANANANAKRILTSQIRNEQFAAVELCSTPLWIIAAKGGSDVKFLSNSLRIHIRSKYEPGLTVLGHWPVVNRWHAQPKQLLVTTAKTHPFL